jgi:hypothetical protein
MKADLQLTLTYDGKTWKVFNELFMAEGDTFKTLDEDLIKSIKSSGSFAHGSRIKIFMDFDDSPVGHKARFFNRYIDLDI